MSTSIRNKYLVAALLLATIPSSILALVLGSRAIAEMEATSREFTEGLLWHASYEVTDMIDARILDGSFLASRESVARVAADVGPDSTGEAADAVAAVQRLFHRYLTRHDNAVQIRLLALSGQELVRVDRTADSVVIAQEATLKDLRGSGAHKASLTLRPGEYWVSPVARLNEDGEPSEHPFLRIVTNAQRDSVITGTLVVTYEQSELLSRLDHVPRMGTIVLARNDGVELELRPSSGLAAARVEGSESIFDHWPELRSAIKTFAEADERHIFGETVHEGEHLSYAILRPSPQSPPWVLGFVRDASIVFAASREMALWTFLLLAASVLVATLIAAQMSRQWSRPILDLSRAANAVADGDLNVRVSSSSEDEVGKLTLAFNDMVREIERLVELEAERLQDVRMGELKNAFVANVSHELRTPLSGVIGMTQLLGQTSLSNTQREFVDVIETSSGALLAVINDLLDLSKIESDELTLTMEPFDPARPMREALSLTAIGADEKGLVLNSRIDNGVPQRVIGDANRVRQVLINLIRNAVKFTNEGAISVSVEFAARSDDEGDLTFSVSDTGIGIEKELQEKLFEPFVQADATTTREHSGTGLGLSISASLIRKMDGRIGVDSRPEVGSRFWITIPVQVPQERSASPRLTPESAVRSAERTDAAGGAGGGHVLVVDDNTINRMVAQLFLEQLGYTSAVAENGADAVAYLMEHPSDFVLMDCQMPVMDGYAATEAIRREPDIADTVVIAMTAHAMVGYRDKCLAAGMNDYLTKPLMIEELGDRLKYWRDAATAA